MKTRFYHLIVLLVSISIISSCSSTNNTKGTDKASGPQVVDTGYGVAFAKDVNQSNAMVNPNENGPSNVSLGDMIRRLPGVQVSGRGNNLRVKISGSESFMSSTDPLYVVNGTAIGTNYAQVVNTLNPNDVTSISVLKGADATIYGTRGANGVILIRTKRN